MNQEIIQEIKRRSLLFVVDNPKFAGQRLAIETVMMIGASIALEQDAIQTGEEVFGPQLSAERRAEMNRLFSQPLLSSEQRAELMRG
jgi:hypothetical protein